MALGTFELDIARFVVKAKGNFDVVFRKISLDLFKRVVIKTPVDEGRARGSWSVAIGAIPANEVHANDKTGTVTMARVAAAVLGLKAGDIIYMVSNLEYIRPLEYGHSKQAPNGMVRLSVAEFPHVVRKAVADLPK